MKHVVTEYHGHTLVVRMNRPEVRNALSLALRTELLQVFTAVRDDANVRAVVLTGTGAAFCAGLDLQELKAAPGKTAEEHRDDSRALGALFGAIAHCPVPVIAAVNGHAVAGGAGFVAAADLAVMSDGATYGFTEVKIGFIPALVSALLLPRIARNVANDLFLTGRLLSADEVLAAGIVNEVVPPDDVLPRALEIAALIGENAPGAVRATKALMLELGAPVLTEALELAASRNAEARLNPELAEGIAAFFEKRHPSWRDTLK